MPTCMLQTSCVCMHDTYSMQAKEATLPWWTAQCVLCQTSSIHHFHSQLETHSCKCPAFPIFPPTWRPARAGGPQLRRR